MGDNTYTGNTPISGGTLILGNELALENSTLDTSGSGVFSLGSSFVSYFGGLTGSGNLALNNAAGQGVLFIIGYDVNGTSTTYSGAMSGSGSLTIGLSLTPGALTLGGSNSFTGITNLFGVGSLVLANTAALAGSTLNARGGTLSFGTLTSATFGGLEGGGTLTLNSAPPLPRPFHCRSAATALRPHIRASWPAVVH